MWQVILILVYVGLAYWVALKGAPTRVGFIGTLLLSLLVTPVLTFIFLYAFGEKSMEAADATASSAPSAPVESKA